MSYGEADCNQEEWRAVVGYEGIYEVSSLGSVKRVKGGQGAVAGRFLTPIIDDWGYLSLGITKNNKRKQFRLHRLVAEAFLGPLPAGHETNHIDGNKQNPRATNLEYITKLENMRHAYHLGLVRWSYKGMEQTNAKLCDQDVRDIRRLYGTVRTKNLAALFDIDVSHAWRIGTRRVWGHLV